MKIIFLGTPSFAVPTLRALVNSHHTVVAVVTQPQKQSGRGQKLTPSAVELEAKKWNIPVFQFTRISKTGVEQLKQLEADVMVTCAFGQILSAEILNMKPFGVMNVHGSLLPKLRGSSPIQWSIINGDKVGGISILKSDVGIDDGKVLLLEPTSILENETAEQLYDRLSQLAPSVLLKALEMLENGTAVFTEQDHSQATVCKKLTKELSKINYEQPVTQLVNLINGINIWPVAQVNVNGLPIKLFHAKVVTPQRAEQLQLKPLSSYTNGEVVVSSAKQGLVLKVQDGFFEVLELQAPNGKRMSAKSYLNGKQIPLGSVLLWTKN